MNTNEASLVTKRWGSAVFTHTLAQIGWMASTSVLMHLNERATGDPARNWLSSWAHHYFVGDSLRILVLGCGEGWLERAVATWPFVKSIDAVDLASSAVERARAAAATSGLTKISYQVLDLNRDPLPVAAYDVIVAHSILHHVENLDHAFDQIESAMRPNATLLINEYVGPRRFQFSDQVMSIMNDLLVCLPERLRRSALEEKTYSFRDRPTEQFMIDTDPSEAIRSDELLPLLRARFDELETIEIGGTILQHLLYDIAQNFRFDQPRERAMIELMCTFEGALIDARVLTSDFALFAARKRTSTLPRSAYRRPFAPRPAEAALVDGDPLGFGRRRRSHAGNGFRAQAKTLTPWLLRMLRIALISNKDNRANLVQERVSRAAIEQLRYKLAGDDRPFRWIAQRWLAKARADDEDSGAILALLRTFDRIASDSSLLHDTLGRT